MSESSLRAIVLRRTDSGESDRRLTLLTFELGKIDAIAKGARKGNSRLGAVSEPLSVAVMSLAPGRHARFVTQAQQSRSFRKMRTSFDRLSFALALTELYAAVLPYEEPVPEVFELLERSLQELEAHEQPLVAFIWCQCKLLEVSGFWPSFDTCVTDGSSVVVAEPWLSPEAGGFLSEESANEYTDRFRTRAEVLYGLARIVDLDVPPANLKFAVPTTLALLPFWKHFVDYRLPSYEYACQICRDSS